MEKFVFEVVKFIASYAIGLLLTLYAAMIAVDIWNWFIVPSTSWPSLPLLAAVGAIYMFSIVGGARLSTADWVAAKAVAGDPSLAIGVAGRSMIIALIYSMIWLTAWVLKVILT